MNTFLWLGFSVLWTATGILESPGSRGGVETCVVSSRWGACIYGRNHVDCGDGLPISFALAAHPA